jgi:hypothetical protein
MSDAQQPATIGRIVHYVYSPGTCMAALVVAAYNHDDNRGHRINVVAFDSMGQRHLALDVAEQSSDHLANSWHWPERA